VSIIRIRINYDQLLWTEMTKDDFPNYSHSWGEHSVAFSSLGVTISCTVDIAEDQRLKLVQSLAKDIEHDRAPHWQDLSPELHHTVLRIEQEVLNAAKFVDFCFRRSPKGVRLPPFNLPERDFNTGQPLKYMTWVFTEEERREVEHVFSGFNRNAKARLSRGLNLPFSQVFSQKQIHMTASEVEQIFSNFSEDDQPPFWELYGLAWENFVGLNQSHASSVLLLCTAIETCLKWCLANSSDQIANLLIDKMPSPRLDQLYDICKTSTDYPFPEHFKGWLAQLAQARNFFAHKPRGASIPLLQIARWFAVGEAVLKATIYEESDPRVGYLIRPAGTPEPSTGLAPEAIGVVLRSEEYHVDKQEKLHVLIDTGVSYYFGLDSGEILPKKKQSFPDIL